MKGCNHNNRKSGRSLNRIFPVERENRWKKKKKLRINFRSFFEESVLIFTSFVATVLLMHQVSDTIYYIRYEMKKKPEFLTNCLLKFAHLMVFQIMRE